MQNKMVRSAEHAEAFLRKVRALVAQRTADEIEQVQYNMVQRRTPFCITAHRCNTAHHVATHRGALPMRPDRTDSHH
jgi:hypothetical protein